MPFLFLFLFLLGASVAYGMPIELSVGLGGFLGFGILLNGLHEGFRACPECGGHLTQMMSEDTPDFSYGWNRSHERVVLECWDPCCRADTVLVGVVCRALTEDEKKKYPELSGMGQ